MRTLVVALYAVSAVLPLLGIARLFVLARREAGPVLQAKPTKDGKGISYDESEKALPAIVNAVRHRPRAILWDFAFIGSGVLAGAAASIWSLYLP
ncbi:hypothetical protein [Microbacterium gilvum]|uniref:hypothetical protein n=1 Tax=Microbacterium gilvum TaxID=1336204 RepID=UPI0031EA2B12